MKVVLASASERRQELLKRIVDDFHIIVSNFNEDEVKLKSSVSDYVKELSLGKAKDVADKVKEPSVIIGVDTIVTINNKILGKPKDKEDAFNMLSELSGNVHKVYSGIAIINTKTNEIMQDFLCTEVKFSTKLVSPAGSKSVESICGVYAETYSGTSGRAPTKLI